ncbi:MAG: phosphoribosylformylglycinamidine synthase subunit PurQ [Gemmataceae bacterium]|nr:phosphoribosylformylglycinamidine synthase subunit PurQ [Gemmataceae bacterium]
MPIVKVLVLRAPGSNCDGELKFAFELAGGRADLVHVNQLRERPALLQKYQILAIPGGFTYGDDVAAGKILAVTLQHFLGDALRQFRDREKLILGVCNGFQVLLKAGVLLTPDLDDGPLATLTHNEPPGFQDRWVWLDSRPGKCPFLRGVDRLFVPIAHGEGRFACRAGWILRGLEQSGQVVLRYSGIVDQPELRNPNGSDGDVAGLCDATGRVLGLMPHPERHVLPVQHPHWTRLGLAAEGDGLRLFRNAIEFFD